MYKNQSILLDLSILILPVVAHYSNDKIEELLIELLDWIREVG